MFNGRFIVQLGSAGLLALLVLFALSVTPGPALAQGGTPTPAAPGDGEEIETPDRVDVVPEARDEEIGQRLQSILEATEWFSGPTVRVEQGVVFLGGRTERQEFKEWAGNLAQRTQDVVAVVNQIEVVQPPLWDFTPAVSGLREQMRQVVRALPLIVISVVILSFAWFFAYVAGIAARRSLRRRDLNRLLISVVGRGVSLLVFLVGIYVVFQVAGLASVALTVLGGTGLLGLVLGIAFQDITENFLASVLLSFQSPFRSGDLVQIDDVTGFVQMMTLRTTVLMTPDGNHVQIPNATVYKSKIYNFTSNPNRRIDFVVGIGYDDSIADAQEIVLGVLREHPAVLGEPEPWVLVDNLGASSVNLQIYVWIDGREYSWQKVKSSLIRLVKRALQAADISMPGETRQLVFPDEITIRQSEAADGAAGDGAAGDGAAGGKARRTATPHGVEPASVSTDAEAGLHSEAGEIEQQARESRPPEEGTDLLEGSGEQ